MKCINLAATAAAFACAAVAAPAVAAPVTLTFEGLGNLSQVGSFYDALGITFSTSAHALISTAAGGDGNFENEPSPSTVMFFSSARSTTLNRAAGIVDALSFYYSSLVPGSVSVYDDLGGTGNLLGEVSLFNQAATGCPGGENFCNWTSLNLAFAGTARSVVFTGQADQSLFDNLSFTAAAVVVNPVSTPATIPLVLAALGGLAMASRRRQT